MSAPVSIGILGSRGKMGSAVARIVGEEFAGRATVAAAADQGDPAEALLDCDAVIDFSLPQAMSALATRALTAKAPLPAFVVGSTGWTIEQRKPVDELAKKTPVLMSSNFSTGVLALLEILRNASPLLERLGYTPVIVETHHRHKKDAPSGTALSLQRVISPAGPGNVPTHSVRAGEVVGDHVVGFYGKSDQVTFGHFAQERSIFARGAVDVALWLSAKRTGSSRSENVGSIIGIDAFFRESYLADKG